MEYTLADRIETARMIVVRGTCTGSSIGICSRCPCYNENGIKMENKYICITNWRDTRESDVPPRAIEYLKKWILENTTSQIEFDL
jgi:hypothetical protein